MLNVFYGTDRKAVKDAATGLIKKLSLKPTVVDDSSYVEGCVTSAIGTSSLFGGVESFLIDTPSANENFNLEVINHLEDLANSANFFIILEGSLLAEPKRKYTKWAEKIEEYQATKAERFNVFQIAEALAKKDKKQMWVLLQQARALNIADEETIGILWWQLKALRLAKLTKSPEEAGMKEYPYKKASQALRNFKEGEVDALSQSLLELYHQGHQGKREMDLALEEWVLKI